MHFPRVAPGDLIPLDIKVYGLPKEKYMISRLRILKQRKASHKYRVIMWHYGNPQYVTQITKTRLNKIMEEFNMVEE